MATEQKPMDDAGNMESRRGLRELLFDRMQIFYYGGAAFLLLVVALFMVDWQTTTGLLLGSLAAVVVALATAAVAWRIARRPAR